MSNTADVTVQSLFCKVPPLTPSRALPPGFSLFCSRLHLAFSELRTAAVLSPHCFLEILQIKTSWGDTTYFSYSLGAGQPATLGHLTLDHPHPPLSNRDTLQNVCVPQEAVVHIQCPRKPENQRQHSLHLRISWRDGKTRGPGDQNLWILGGAEKNNFQVLEECNKEEVDLIDSKEVETACATLDLEDARQKETRYGQ